ncbi:MAG TPA: hypothetical protein VNG89_09515 [Vicinamibacterales bacterium]|nr:hypothetical protein [Vicinamibacterales bacterium]
MPTHPGLADLLRYPLMSALAERRTRRIAQGVSLIAAGLSHTSTNQPKPLSELEEAILVVSTGLTGPVMHDGPLKKPDGRDELGSPFDHVIGKTASSPDNAHATSFFLINDKGIWLIKTPRDRDALQLLGSLPPQWDQWSEDDWIRVANAVKVQVFDRRLDFPREFPYYLGWNKQTSNVPGSTVLFPVVDCTRQYINALLTVLAEPDGQRPVFIDDWQRFEPADLVEGAVWVGAQFGFPKRIPYQPIGGIKWVQNGFCNKDISAPLGMQRAIRTDYESFFLLQNLMLVAQAMGLGGWIHSSVFAPWILHNEPDKGWHGLGFHFTTPDRDWGLNWPPLPSTQPNPVGIDGVLEGLCPPYVASMNDAVDIFIQEKYGPQGMYGDKDTFAIPFKNRADSDDYLKHQVPFSPMAIEYCKEVCTYQMEKYDRFPAFVDAFYVPGIWLQVSHLEIEYYQKFFKPSLYRNQAAHAQTWGENS